MGLSINLLVVLLASLAAWLMRFGGQSITVEYLLALVSGLFLSSVLFSLSGAFRPEIRSDFGRSFRRLFTSWILVFFLLGSVAIALKMTENFSRLWFGYWLLYGIAGLAIGAWVQSTAYRYFERKQWQGKKILLTGSPDNMLEIFDKLKAAGSVNHIEHLAYQAEQTNCLLEKLRVGHFHQVWIATSWQEPGLLKDILKQLKDTTADIRVIPDLFQFQLFSNRSVEAMGIPMIELSGTDIAGPEKMLKLVLDRVFSILALLIISPLYLFIALVIKLSSKGPIYFRQQRLGFSGEPISILKFRSMYQQPPAQASTAAQQATQNDTRVTPFGKFLRRTSLDELPQLINVLKGEMSLVGPRPHAQTQNDHFRDLIPRYMLRHKVKPGMTGWAQINGYRGETDTLEKMNKRIEYDLWYIRNWSLWLDITILLRTPMAVIKGNNAY